MKLREFPVTTDIDRRRQQFKVKNPRAAVRNRVLRPLLEPLEVRLAPATINWVNPAGGDWDTASNWQGGVVPGANDDAVINEPGNVTITHSGSSTDSVGSLTASDPITLSGGTLNVSGVFSDTSAVTLSGGTLANATVPAGTTVGGSGTLSDVTLAGTLNLAVFESAVSIVNNLTLASGLVETTNIASLNFTGTQSLAGTGEVLFNGGKNPNNAINVGGTGSVLTIESGITVDGLSAAIHAGAGTIDNFGTLSVGSSDGMESAALAGGTFTIDGAWTNEPGATAQAVNDGNLVLNSMGANDGGNIVPSGVWTNDAGATISVTGKSDDGGSLSLEGNGWSNAGTIAMTNSSIYLGGTFTLAALGDFSRTGGTVYLTGTLYNSGTLALNNTTGSWELDSGTIDGGIITTAGTAVLGTQVQANGTTATLNGVTLAGTLDDNIGVFNSVTVTNGLVLNSGLVEIALGGVLNFSGSQSLGGTGNILFTSTGGNTDAYLSVVGSGSMLTIGPNVTIHGNSGSVGAGTGSIVNDGIVSADVSGGLIDLSGAWTNNNTIQAIDGNSLSFNGNWTNNSTIGVSGGGTLNLNITESDDWTNAGTITMTGSTVDLGGTFTLAALGTFTRTGGTVNLTGMLTNSDNTLALTSSGTNPTGTWQLDGGTIDGGTISTPGSAVLADVYEAQSAMVGVTLAGTLDLTAGNFTTTTITNGLTLENGQVNISGGDSMTFSGSQTLGGTGTITFADGSSNNALFIAGNASSLVIGPNVMIDGNTGSIFASNGDAGLGNSGFVNEGTILANTGFGSIVLLATNWSNTGTIEALSGSTIDFGENGSGSTEEGSFSNSGTIIGAAGFIYLKSTFNNNGSTLALNGATGSWYIEYGSIDGGIVSTAGGAELVATNDGGTLAGVTLAGTLDLAYPSFTRATVNVTGGLTLDQGTVNIAASDSLVFQGSQSLSGTGTVSLASVTTGDGLLVPTIGSALTIGSGVMVQGNSGEVGSSGSAGLITNQGTIEATGGGALTVQGFTNLAGGTLTGGTWGAIGGSDLRLVGAAIITNAASILLDGPSAHVYGAASGTTNALAGFMSNAATGSFTIQNAVNFISSGVFANAGTLTINSGATFTLGGAGAYTQTGGMTILSAGTLGTAGSQINIDGGILSGPGSLIGNLTNAGEVDLASDPGTLIVTGNYSQAPAGSLTIKIGGATAGTLFDQVNVTGTAALDGTLNVALINGFAPGLAEPFGVMNFASSTGSFATFNSPKIGSVAALIIDTTPTSVDLVGATSAPNLAVSNIAFSPSQAFLSQSVAVTFTVTNLGTVATTAGSWTDSIYLSLDTTIDAGAVLLGRILHTGDLAAFSQYTTTLTSPVPGIIPGSYHVIVVTDSGLQVPDFNRANGTDVAPTEIAIQPPTLLIGTPLTGTIANGQDLYYRLDVAPGTSVALAATFATALESELSVLQGTLPTDSNMGLSSSNLNDLSPQLQLPTGQGGDYYIWLHGREGAATGQPFTLLATLDTFEVDSFSESSASNSGPVTMNVTGAGFTPQTAVILKDGSSTVTAQTTTFINANDLTVTFDLINQPVGSYVVQAVEAGQSATAPGTFQVTAQAASDLQWFETAAPTSLFPYAFESLAAGVTNDGTTDAQVPPFTISVSGLYAGSPLPGYDYTPTPVGGSGFLYPGGTLAPGQSIREVYAGDVGLSSGFIALAGVSPDSSLVLEAEKPFGIPAAAWTAIVNNLITNLGGETVSDEEKAFQADAVYLAQVGDAVTDQSTLFGFEMLKAEDGLPSAILSSAVDSQSAEPGLSLTFARTFNSSLVGRYTLGDLGYGWTSNWDISAATDPSGNVYIQEGSVTREFQNLGNGQYQGADGDQGILTQTQGSYTLRDTDGLVTTFLTDGQLNTITDSNGNSVTAGYTGKLMTSLNASNGDKLLIGYNSQGLISQITSPAGSVTTYEYDTNDQLISVSGANGITQYAYINGQGPAQEHALSVITDPDGTHTYFVYDSEGRLIEQSGDDGAGAITYAYLSPGGYTATDATGAVTTVLFDSDGLPAVVKDPLGNVSEVTYNGDGQPVLTSYPGGSASSTTYDSNGNITSQTDPLGNVTQYSTNASGELESLQNPDGNTTSFSYTTQGSLSSITQPDGTAASYGYNAKGEISESIDALGRVTHYTYDSHGRMTLRQNSDGTSTAYGYDANGNLTSVTDASGTIMMSYNGANELTMIVYPNGQSLTYAYNAEQLTQIVSPSGFTENYTYTAAGQLSEVTDGNGNLIVSYTYDLAGRLVGQINGNGTYTTYTYTRDGLISDLSNFAPDGTVNSSFLYTYNALGLATSMTTPAGTTTYGYDADGQLTSAQLPTGELITYAYDADGNRTVVSDTGATMTTYATNNLNQYTSVGASTYSYDANGNLVVTTGAGGNTTYTYDAENRLIRETTPTDTYTYQYDALGNLASSTDNGQTTQYLINPLGDGNVAAEYNGSGNLIANFTYGVGLISQVNAAGAAAYYDYDAVGSTAGLSGPTGHYLDSYTYLPFGAIQSATAGLANPFQYIGKSGVMTMGGGLDDMRARFYSPAIGRFINRDPANLAGGHNLYAYADNNPVSYADPTGLVFFEMLTPYQQAAVQAYIQDMQQNFIDECASQGITATAEDVAQIGNAEQTALGFLASDGSIANVSDALSMIAANAPLADTIPIVANPDTIVDGTLALAVADTVVAAAPVTTTTLLGLGPAASAAGAFVAGAIVDAIPPIALLAVAGALVYEIDGLYNDLNVETSYSPGVNGGQADFTVLPKPKDPNFIAGPGGFGVQAFVASGYSLPYVIGFENDATATAPAQSVTVTQQLDPNLDWSTFQLGDFSFGGTFYPVPAGLTSYSTQIDAISTVGVYVDISADFDELTGLLTWNFTSIDPTTLDQPVGNFEEGFLPPDLTIPEGDGAVSYTVEPKASDSTGTTINAQATVYFNPGLINGSSLETSSFFNTIDSGSPTSSVSVLPSFSPANFNVSWAGQDDAGGSGIASYNVYVSDDDGPFAIWQSATAQTSATFTGQNGHTYGFYSLATDNAGNVQRTPGVAQATTDVDTVAPTSHIIALPETESTTSFAVKWSGQDAPGGSGIAGYNIYVSDDGGAYTLWQSDTTATSATFTGHIGDSYRFYSVATDNVGNVEATPSSAQATTTVVNTPTPTPTPVPTPTQTPSAPMIVGEQALFERKPKKKGKPVLVGYELVFSTAVNPASAMNASNYQVDSVTIKKAKQKTEKILHPLSSFSVTYSPTNDSITLMLAGKPAFMAGGQITILSGVTGAQGGTLSGTTVFTISKGGKKIEPA